MEVHHHPKAEKKNFKEYLLEGLMIFLAVSLGFIAENIREKITENEKANTYAAFLLKDLELDTTALIAYNRYYNNTVNCADTLIKLLGKDEPKNIPSGKLYWYGLGAAGSNYFVPNDATLQQLINSGSVRYFKKEVAEKIAKYDRAIRILKNKDDLFIGIYTETRKARSLIFNFKYLDDANKIYRNLYSNMHKPLITGSPLIDSFIKTNPPLLDTDKIKFNQFIEMVRSRFLYQNLTFSADALVEARNLISSLKKEYQVEKE